MLNTAKQREVATEQQKKKNEVENQLNATTNQRMNVDSSNESAIIIS